MNNFINRKVALVGSGLTLVATQSQAAIDTAAITAGITDAGTAIATIGAAVVLILLGVKVFKWIARSL